MHETSSFACSPVGVAARRPVGVCCIPGCALPQLVCFGTFPSQGRLWRDRFWRYEELPPGHRNPRHHLRWLLHHVCHVVHCTQGGKWGAAPTRWYDDAVAACSERCSSSCCCGRSARPVGGLLHPKPHPTPLRPSPPPPPSPPLPLLPPPLSSLSSLPPPGPLTPSLLSPSSLSSLPPPPPSLSSPFS